MESLNLHIIYFTINVTYVVSEQALLSLFAIPNSLLRSLL